MNIAIIEDEILMADEIENELLTINSEINVIGKFHSIEDTSTYFLNNDLPDLFISDIHLRDGLSFEIYKSLKVNVPVIFITAYDEYALKAFRSYGIDYLLKPLDNGTLKLAINKFLMLQNKTNESFNDKLDLLLKELQISNREQNNSILIYNGKSISPLKIQDIGLACILNGITYILSQDGKKNVYEGTLESLSRELDNNFFKINRQVIIHRDSIHHIEHFHARKLRIQSTLKVDFDLVVSKANATKFLTWIKRN